MLAFEYNFFVSLNLEFEKILYYCAQDYKTFIIHIEKV